MPFSCPHCTKEIADVLTQEEHVRRLNVKEAANEALRGQITTLQTKADAATALETKVTTLQGELDKQKGASAKIIAAAKVGLNPDKMRLAETAYDMAHEGVEASKRPAFDAWLIDENGARKNEDIQHLFAAAAPPKGTQPPPTPPRKPDMPPTPPPNPGQKPTQAQLDAYFKSAEFRGMKREDQVKKMNELKGQIAAAPTQDGRA